jgi:death-on-curing protein
LQNEPAWLPLAEVIAINKSAVSASGENHQLLNMGLLESALSRPEQRFNYGQEDDIIVLAAELFDAIAQNHPLARQQANGLDCGGLIPRGQRLSGAATRGR